MNFNLNLLNLNDESENVGEIDHYIDVAEPEVDVVELMKRNVADYNGNCKKNLKDNFSRTYDSKVKITVERINKHNVRSKFILMIKDTANGNQFRSKGNDQIRMF